MAATADSPEHQADMERQRVERDREDGTIDEESADLIAEFLAAIHPDDYTVQPGELGTKSYSTVEAYGRNLRLVAAEAGAPLADLTVRDLNEHFSNLDLAKATIAQRQATVRVFYRYHDQIGVDPELIAIDKPDPSTVDPRDLFTREEIDALHEAMDNTRDRALFDLMLYTGQRLRAVLTLKVGDVDLESGRFYLNTDAAGLKGAKGMRPLLVAQSSVSDWLRDHPAGDDPDAYLISKLPDAASGGVYEPLHQPSINRRLKKIAKEAGLDRSEERGHAHMCRHTFVRWAYVNRGMDIPTIKFMTGHAKDSQTLERTYMNIFEGDFAKKAEVAAGTANEDEEDHLTPEVCPICKFGPLPEGARACPRCTNVLTPDGAQAREELEDDLKADYRDADPEDHETTDLLDEFDEMLADYPELEARLLERLGGD